MWIAADQMQKGSYEKKKIKNLSASLQNPSKINVNTPSDGRQLTKG